MLPLETLAQLDQVTLPFLPILQFQQFWMQSQLYQSNLKLTVDLPGMSTLNISLDELMLQQVPLANTLPFGFLAGVLSLEGEIKNLAQLQRRQQLLPIGTLQGSMTDFRFRLNQEHPLLNGLSITELNLPEVSYVISMQQQLIEISQLTLNGDLEGNITGNIRLNERNLLESRIDLDLKVRLSQKLQDQLGLFTMMLQGFRCGDFLDVKIRGTFRQISPPFRNRCT
jgi:type II secretion system protein N